VFHGIEALRKAGNGYVYWRGIRVDHYSYPDDETGQERERAAAHELAEQCRHLEALGVSVRRVGDFSWFAGMTMATPAAYRTFVGGADNFLEHPDGSLAWQFVHDRRVKGAKEDTEIETVYVWRNGALGRRSVTGYVYRAGIYHVMRADGWETADCGQGRTRSGGAMNTLWGVTWEEIHALLQRHGLTSEVLEAHVLATMPAPPPPPKPVATLAEAKRALAQELVRGLKEGDGWLPEADDDINDASRAVVQFMATEHGHAWLGEINLEGDARRLPIMWQWDGTPVHNFGASFVCPQQDAELERLIRERHDAPYTGTKEDATRVDAIRARLKAIGGVHLHWT
jgi:hypothetical protein